MDARRSQVYNAVFEAREGQLIRLCEDRAISLAELGQELKDLQKPVFIVGDGAQLCYNTLCEQIPIPVLPPEHRRHQRAAGVALVAQQKILDGQSGDAATLNPNYLRLSQAERERLEKQNKEN